MSFWNTTRNSVAMTAFTAVASLAQAGPYYGLDYQAQRAAFDLAVTRVAEESFETVTRGLVSEQPLNGAIRSIAVFGGVGTLSQAADLAPARGARVTNNISGGRFNTTVGGAYWVESDSSFTILLGRDVEAFGFFGTDFGDFAGGLSIALYNDGFAVVPDVFTDGNSGTLIPPFTDSGALTFLGYSSSTKFDEMRFTIRQDAASADLYDIYGFDDLIVGNLRTTGGTIPEPGSLALVGLALFAAGWARKAQRRA